jgi:hypothetical protein
MKTLIEKSIVIRGIGSTQTKTVFNIKNESERNLIGFKSLTVISGRKLTVEFKYEEDETEKSDKLQVTIPRLENEDEIKDFILNEINTKLN